MATGVAAVVVAYRPDAGGLDRLLERLAAQVDTTYLVDNSDDEASRRLIAEAARRSGARTIAMGGNLGVAAAQNRGLDAAAADGHRHGLLFDDDSLPPADLVARLLDGWRRAAAQPGRPIAAVGPVVTDVRDDDAVLVFAHTWIGPRRVPGLSRARRTGERDAPIEVAFLVASGCLVDLDAVRAVGGMREDLFIDHVDLEWCLRARRAGWRLLAIPDVRLEHRLGEQLVRLPTPGGRPVHIHVPLRNYYLVRNTLLLLRGDLLPTGWRLGYLLWLLRYAAFNLAFFAPRVQRLRMIWRGLLDGLSGRAGRGQVPQPGRGR